MTNGEVNGRGHHRWQGAPEPTAYQQGAGVRLAGDTWGDASGPLVVLQHGGGQTRHAWRGAGEVLGAAGYFAVAFDARGHGDSDWATDGNSERLPDAFGARCLTGPNGC